MAAAETYVSSITGLLSTLEQQTLARIETLRLIQIISLAFSILIISIVLPQLRNRLLRPLSKLLGIAQAVSRRDFSQKAELRGSDELAQLGRAFDQMTFDLELAHISQEALQLLHDASRGLS